MRVFFAQVAVLIGSLSGNVSVVKSIWLQFEITTASSLEQPFHEKSCGKVRQSVEKDPSSPQIQ